jgi:hypothetical protein
MVRNAIPMRPPIAPSRLERCRHGDVIRLVLGGHVGQKYPALGGLNGRSRILSLPIAINASKYQKCNHRQENFPGVPREIGSLSITPSRQRISSMGIEKDIIKLVKAEGYKINESIRDALDEFIDIVKEEGESSEENAETEEKLAKDDDS